MIKKLLPEKIKKPLRKIYHFCYRIVLKAFYLNKMRLKDSYRLLHAILFSKSPVCIKLNNIDNPIILRPKTSDIPTFEKIFILEEYNFFVSFFPKYIIDAGANVGYSALYFASKYPNSKIICIEPEKSNIAILNQNLSNYRNIEVIEKALWHRKTFLTIKNPLEEKYAFQVEETESSDLESITIYDILQEKHFPFIDILKIDIEGAEKFVFAENTGWLEKVKCIVIELHEELMPGSKKNFYNAISKYSFKESRKGENLIFIK